MSSLPRIATDLFTNPVQGEVRLSLQKSLWISGMYGAAFIGGYYYFSFSGVCLFLFTTLFTLCTGHSVGMHRRLIHNSFECPLWLEYILVHMGVLVGLAGPFGMIRTHDMRDWAQRQKACHPYFSHRSGFIKDAFWQMHCELELLHSPVIVIESRVAEDPFYRFMEKYWQWQQLPWAILFYMLGGWGWVVWGICARVATCVTGHWLIGYFAHNQGHQDWQVQGAGVQGYNVKFCGLITMGEAWHNNHHAFPGSANIGLYEGQPDPGWWLIQWLAARGLAWNIQTCRDLPPRPELRRVISLKYPRKPCRFGKIVRNYLYEI